MEVSDAVSALGALAQVSRLQAFRLLVQAGHAGLPAGLLAERLGLPPATLSFHLAQLGHAGLVHSRRNGRQVIYAADYAGMDRLMCFLTENCCQGMPAEVTGIRLDPRPKRRSASVATRRTARRGRQGERT